MWKSLKMGRLLFLVLLAAGLLMTGCSDDEDPTSPGTNTEPVVNSATVILEETGPSQISDYDLDTGNLTLAGDSEYEESLTVGSVIVSDVSEQFPQGVLRRVTGVDKSTQQAVIQTEQATLEDLFEEVDVQWMENLDMSDLDQEKSTHLAGVTLDGSKSVDGHFVLKFEDVVLFDADGDGSTTNDQVKMVGDLTLDPSLELSFQVKWLKLKQLRFVASMEEEAKVNIQAELELLKLEKTYEVARWHFTPFTVMAGPVPVVFTPIITVNVGAEGAVTVGVSTGIEQTASVAAGLKYENGNWSPVSESSFAFSYIPPKVSAGCEVKAFAGPQFNLLVYGIVGPFANLEGYLELETDVFGDPWWTLSGGCEANSGVRVEVLGRNIVDYTLPNVISYEIVLAQAGGDPKGTIAVEVIPSDLDASWGLVGSPGFSHDESGSVEFDDMEPGVYTITWGDVEGWVTPDPETLELGPGGAISFTGLYEEIIDGPTVFGDFGLTNPGYAPDGDWNQIVKEIFGPDYRVADWKDLEDLYEAEGAGAITELMDGLGMVWKNSAFVERNGQRQWSSDRYYFMSRHDHNKPGTYLAHDNIDNYLVSLGSWYGTRRILAIRDADPQGYGNVALLARGAFATANGEFPHWNNGPMKAEFAIDDNLVSYWAGLQGVAPQSIIITFDRAYDIDRIKVMERFEGSYFTRATIEYYDGNQWKPLLEKVKAAPGMDESFTSVKTAKVRVTIHDLVAPSSWYNKVACLHAIEIYGE